MPGMVIEVKVKAGEEIKKGKPICILSAMKMETAVGSPKDGKIKKVYVQKDDNITPGDLLAELE